MFPAVSKHFKHVVRSCAAAIGTLLLSLNFAATAYAASPVVYSTSSSAGGVQPNSTIQINLSVTTSSVIAGGSVHVTYSGGSFAGFQSAPTPSPFYFIDYHQDFADVVYICTNNNCAPGTYLIATMTVQAAAAGTVTVTFTPKETFDPQLAPVAADGASNAHTITSTAQPSPPKVVTNRYTVPSDTGNGTVEPLQVTAEKLTDQVEYAVKKNEETAAKVEEKQSFWTPRNVVLLGVGIGASVSICVLAAVKILGISIFPKGPTGMGGGGTPGPTIYPS